MDERKASLIWPHPSLLDGRDLSLRNDKFLQTEPTRWTQGSPGDCLKYYAHRREGLCHYVMTKLLCWSGYRRMI
jgi:hypothetical protein